MRKPEDTMKLVIDATDSGKLRWQFMRNDIMQCHYETLSLKLYRNKHRDVLCLDVFGIPDTLKWHNRNTPITLSEGIAPNIIELYGKAKLVAVAQDKIIDELLKDEEGNWFGNKYITTETTSGNYFTRFLYRLCSRIR